MRVSARDNWPMALAATKRRPALIDLAAASYENTFVHELPAEIQDRLEQEIAGGMW